MARAEEGSDTTLSEPCTGNGDNRALPGALPVGASSKSLAQGQPEPNTAKDMNGSISGRSNDVVRSDGSELSHFISDGDVCSFITSILGIDTVEKFASADRFQIAQRLFSWYEERAANEGGSAVASSNRTRPLKVLEAQIFSWRLQMNKLRAHHGLPLLPPDSALITRESEGACNAESEPKESAESVADSAKVNSNEASGATTRGKTSNDASSKRRKRLPEELSSNKELIAARNILSSTDDLVTVLPEEECRFLGNRFWIFTVQQLMSVLAQDGTVSEETKLESEAPLNVSKRHLVEAIMREMTKVAESSSAAPNGASIVQNEQEGMAVEKRRISAEALISTWKTKLNARRKPSPDDVLRSFSLNGPLSILSPPALIQFLNSAGVDTAYDFIAARKTEHSLLVNLFIIWQEKQQMKAARPEKAARFLMSVSSRVQSAITSIAPADSFTRAWSTSNLITLTSTARDFIIFHCRYSDDNAFLEEQTGNIAKRLDSFRAEKGMPVLKGTGNVAMVSSWRTLVKDAGDLGESLREPLPVVSLDIKAIVAAQNAGFGNVGVGKTNAPVPTRGKKQRSAGSSGAALRTNTLSSSAPTLKPPRDHLSDDVNLVMHELQSNDFMQRVLKPSQAKFLQSAGISNADQLLRSDKSEKSGIVQSLIRWRRDRGFDEIPATSASKAILDWSQKVETELSAIKQKRRRELEVENEAEVLKSDATRKSGGGANRSRQIKKKKRVVPKKFQEETGLDPIEAISPTAREFLATIGVTKAEQFLSKTTSDLGSAFISWRSRTGLDELKGAGAISIVSGWKGQVRDVCEYLGKQALIDLDASVRHKSLSGRGSDPECSGGTRRKERPMQLAYNAPIRASVAIPDDESLGPNVLDKPEDRYVCRPDILNGLPSRNFTVRGDGIDPALYDFQLSVRRREAVNDSSSADDVSVCLTYQGARINKFSTNHLGDAGNRPGDLPQSHASSALPSVLPILFDCSDGGRRSDSDEENTEQSHITFCSLAAATPANDITSGGLIDLTRFHIFPPLSAPSKDVTSKRYEYAKDQLEAFVEGKKGGDETQNAEAIKYTQENKKTENTKANVSAVLDPASGKKQYILCLANPIEKGQTLELFLSDASTIAPTLSEKISDMSFGQNDASDHKLRHRITTLIESMAANEIVESLVFLERKIAAVTDQLEQFGHSSQTLGQASAISLDTESNKPIDCDQESSLISSFTCRRKIHFVASITLRQVKALLKESRLLQLDRTMLADTTGRLDKLLWDKLSVKATKLIAQHEGAGPAVLDEALIREAMNELRFSMARQGVCGPRCPLSSQLDGVVTQLIARYALTTAGSSLGSNQQTLLKEIYLAAQNSARDLHSICTARSQDDILRLILPSEIVLDSHRRMSCLPRGMPLHIASALPNLSFASIGANSFQRPLPNAQKQPENSFIVLKADSGFSSTSIALLLDKHSVSDLSLIVGGLTSSSRRLNLSIDIGWYLHNQIISPADEISRCGFVSWCKPIHALCAPSYSLKDLTEAVVQSLRDVMVDLPDDSIDFSTVGIFRGIRMSQSIQLYLPSQKNEVLAHATRADYFPRTLPIFLRIIFPHLEQKFSWKVHCGRSPESLTYIPPETLHKRRKDASFDFTASERRRKKTTRKMQKANVSTSKLPRNLRQICITFAKRVAKTDESDGPDTGDVEVDSNSTSAQNDARNSDLYAPEAAGRPANDAMNAFVESIDFNGDDSQRAAATLIGESILRLFDKMIPASFPSATAGTASEGNAEALSSVSTGAKLPRESYCCEHFLWWMVLLPDLLAKSGLPLRQQEIIEAFVEALLLYLSRNHSKMFTLFDYSDSIAIDEAPTESVDISQLVLEILKKASDETKDDEIDSTASTAAADDTDPDKVANDEELSTVVLRDHEKYLLTDYVSHALQQVQLCFLREEDLSSGKRGAFRVGFPGIVCKHCKESKMFYSNVSSLSACPAGIHIHCQRCSRCPKEIAREFDEKKKLHNQQKKIIKMGSMAKFYHSLYKRMMRMRRSKEDGAFFDESSSDEQSDEDENESDGQAATDDDNNDIASEDDIFFDHIDAIRSVAEDKFYQRRNMASVIDLYYQCVKRGGLLWKTDALPSSLPDFMVSEWLLKLILRRLDRGLPLVSVTPPEIEVGASSAAAIPANASSHYGPTSFAASKPSNKICSVEGCTKHRQSKCDGMCRAHWSEMQRTGVRPGPVNTKNNHGTKRKSSSLDGGVGIQSSHAWTCNQCGEDNDAESQRCGGCKGWRGGKRRSTHNSIPVAVVQSTPWTCRLCGKENSGTRQRCIYPCRAWRDGKRVQPGK